MRFFSALLAAGMAAGVSVEFGLARFDEAPEGWKLMSVSDLETYKIQLVTAYNKNGGLNVVKSFLSGNCCIAVSGGKKVTISGTPFKYQFPASQNGALQCNPKGGYALGSKYQFYKLPTLKAGISFNAMDVCSTDKNPGMFMKLVPQDPAQQLRELLPSRVQFGFYDAETRPGGGWELMSVKDFKSYGAQFRDYYNAHQGLKGWFFFNTNCHHCKLLAILLILTHHRNNITLSVFLNSNQSFPEWKLLFRYQKSN
jgi:hypothetical protein